MSSPASENGPAPDLNALTARALEMRAELEKIAKTTAQWLEYLGQLPSIQKRVEQPERRFAAAHARNNLNAEIQRLTEHIDKLQEGLDGLKHHRRVLEAIRDELK